MPLPFRRPRISPDFIAVPAEQTIVPDEVRIAELDEHLAVIAEVPRAQRPEGFTRRADHLLDLRNAIRPPRDRVGSIIDNRRENP
jgi:hypothetical protein